MKDKIEYENEKMIEIRNNPEKEEHNITIIPKNKMSESSFHK